MNILLVTPWPPQRTGIADYAYDLCSGFLAAGHTVTVVTEESAPRPLEGARFMPPDYLAPGTRARYDTILYQLGNNSSFHTYQIRLLPRFPGVVHLHDMALHHLMAWLAYLHGSKALYRRLLAKWYGPFVAEHGWDMLSRGEGMWDSGLVIEVPFFEEALQHATALIAHSRYARDKVTARFAHLPSLVLPQLYRETCAAGTARPPRREGAFRIGLFGGVAANKRPSVVLAACEACLEAGLAIELHITGKVDEDCRAMFAALEGTKLGAVTHLHGYTEHAEFLARISAMDLCVALRHPTMGETSAVVMRALQAGTPAIVSDTGWYSELPDLVPKIPACAPEDRDALIAWLLRLADFGPDYRDLLARTADYAAKELDFTTTVRRYTEFLAQEMLTRDEKESA